MSGGPKRPEYEPRDDVQRLGYLVEECGEVIAAAGKTIRWGLQSYNPELPPEERERNSEWLLREVEDLQAAIDRAMPMLVEAAAPRCGNVSKSQRGVPDGHVCTRRIGHDDRGQRGHTDGHAMWVHMDPPAPRSTEEGTPDAEPDDGTCYVCEERTAEVMIVPTAKAEFALRAAGMWPVEPAAEPPADTRDEDEEPEALRGCDDCSGPANGPGDAECVNCDCGAVVCSACCEAVDGESYCRDCAAERRGAADMRDPLSDKDWPLPLCLGAVWKPPVPHGHGWYIESPRGQGWCIDGEGDARSNILHPDATALIRARNLAARAKAAAP